MQIYGPAHLHGAQAISAPHIHPQQSNNRANASAAPRGIDTQDTLEISSEGLFAEQVKDLPEMRTDRINQIRQQIANGTYETDDKIDLALSRMLDEIG